MPTIVVSRTDINHAIDNAAAWLVHDGILVTPRTLFDRLYHSYNIERGSKVPYVQELAAAKFKAMLEIHERNPHECDIYPLL